MNLEQRVERLEGQAGQPRVCRCGVEHLLGARAIAMAGAGEDVSDPCPVCGGEEIVLRMDPALMR